MTMSLIEHIEVGSGGAASIEFTSIPASYTDLKIVLSGRSDYTAADDFWKIEFNTYVTLPTGRLLYGTGSAAASTTKSDGWLAPMPDDDTWTSNTFASAEVYIPNYTSSAAKSISSQGVAENNATASLQAINASLWNVTDAITSIKLSSGNSATLLQYSSATLYGIRKYDTTGSPKATGGIISFDSVNNKWVHIFTASGTFTPTENLSNVEYLVVAGGGGGGNDIGAGGGAGGYRSSVTGESSGGGASAESKLSLTASTGYTVTVGGGGSASSNGSNSVFDTITATGGGAGASVANGSSGGSGGGGRSTGGLGGAGTANQGYAGGDGANNAAGGGGGAGSAGGDAGSAVGGNGGAGVSSSVSGSSIERAGGGGGLGYLGTNGSGFAGGGSAPSVAGSPNTGGGGGGAALSGTGGAGGSGVVIVRYAA